MKGWERLGMTGLGESTAIMTCQVGLSVGLASFEAGDLSLCAHNCMYTASEAMCERETSSIFKRPTPTCIGSSKANLIAVLGFVVSS